MKQSSSKSKGKENVIGIVSGLSESENSAVKKWLEHKSMQSKSKVQLEVITAVRTDSGPVIDLADPNKYSLLVFVLDLLSENRMDDNSLINDLGSNLSEGIPFLIMATNRDKVEGDETAIIGDVTTDLNLEGLTGKHSFKVVPVNVNSNQRSENEEAICEFLKRSFPKNKGGCQIS